MRYFIPISIASFGCGILNKGCYSPIQNATEDFAHIFGVQITQKFGEQSLLKFDLRLVLLKLPLLN
jgi:hypothetical protein